MNFSAFSPPSSVFTSANGKASSAAYAIINPASAVVPEIDGALIPQVGFLIACLFLILGRRKESTEPEFAV